MRRNGGGLEGERWQIWSGGNGEGSWMVLSFKVRNLLSNAEISLSTRAHSEPHMSFNMYADGQAVTQVAPVRASSG